MNLEELPTEAPVTEDPVVEQPAAPEAPVFAWQLTDDPPPAIVPTEQIRQIIREEQERAQAANREPDYEEVLIDKAVRAMEERSAVREAPRARRDLVEDLTVGLGQEAKTYLNGYIKDYTADVVTAIRNDPKTMDMLRRAAEHENGKVSAPKPAPRTEGTTTLHENADPQIDGQLLGMWNGGFKDAFEGMGKTYADFEKQMKARVS